MAVLNARLWKSHGFGKQPNEDQLDTLRARCEEDPDFYIFGGFVRTYNENAPANDRIQVMPADKPYLRRTLDHVHSDNGHTTKATLKSRQMMISWLACAYATWEARSHDHSRVMWQSLKAEHAWDMVYRRTWTQARCAFIEIANPKCLWSMGLIGTRGELTYERGSIIRGVPEGADQARSFVSNLYICDEASFQPEFEDAYGAILPMAKKIWAISSAEGGSFFGDLVEQNETKEEAA